MSAGPVLLVSHLASPTQLTGAEQSLLLLAGELKRSREVAVLSPSEGQSVSRARALGLAVEVEPWPRLFAASWRASVFGTSLRLARFVASSSELLSLTATLRRHQGAVALVNTLVNVGAAWAARRAGLRVVWRVAEIPGPGPRRRFFARALESLADEVVVVSQAVALAIGVRRARVVPSGVVTPNQESIAEARRQLRERLRLDQGELLVGHVGQVLPHKGQLEFLRAACASQTTRSPTSVHYAVIGSLDADAGYARRLRAAARPLGARVHFPGFVAAATMALDLMVFTSTAPDPFPLVVLEAMAAGVPVVGFAGGGVPEAVADGVSGRLVRVGDVATLAAALHGLCCNADLRAELGKGARERVAREFTIARTGAAYAAILDEVAARG